jgi:hypothetical protein
VASLALVKHVVRDDPIPLVGCEKNHFNEKLTIHPDARERSFPGCRLLAANIFDLFFTRGFSEKCYFFPVGFLFHDEGSPLPTKIF